MEIILADHFTIEIKNIPKNSRVLVRELAKNGAKKIQEEMAEAFENEEYGAGPLGNNDPKYNQWKMNSGHDPRRGHLKGKLQNAFWNYNLFNFNASGDKITIHFDRNKMRGNVNKYAGIYEEMKAPEGLVYIADEWFRDFERDIAGSVPNIPVNPPKNRKGKRISSFSNIAALLPKTLNLSRFLF